MVMNVSKNMQQKLLDRTVERLLERNPPAKVSRSDLRKLHLAWGNLGFMASIGYLEHVARAVEQVNGPILECGSGLSTLLMAVMTKGLNTPIYALENHEGWMYRMECTMERYDFDHVHMIHAPLKNFGEYDWYDFDKSVLSPDLDLIICDGPPGNIKGCRYGLIPEMYEYMGNSCRILLDDASRRNEKRVLRNWHSRYGCDYELKGFLQKVALINHTKSFVVSG